MAALQQLQTEYREQLKPIFGIDFDEWVNKGIIEQLKAELLQRERRRFEIGKRYGVTTIDVADHALSVGRLTEEEVNEDDYIELAELEKEIKTIRQLIEK